MMVLPTSISVPRQSFIDDHTSHLDVRIASTNRRSLCIMLNEWQHLAPIPHSHDNSILNFNIDCCRSMDRCSITVESTWYRWQLCTKVPLTNDLQSHCYLISLVGYARLPGLVPAYCPRYLWFPKPADYFLPRTSFTGLRLSDTARAVDRRRHCCQLLKRCIRSLPAIVVQRLLVITIKDACCHGRTLTRDSRDECWWHKIDTHSIVRSEEHTSELQS